ncbi:MAG: hypothetical protein O3A46_09640 [Candidatus Poribacteria bacterium]|nr:hypothetical protein [Candidatus Poribacteria bacterium]
MLDRLHQHLLMELGQNTRSNAVFVLVSILMNLMTTAFNATLAADDRVVTKAMLIVTMAVVVIVNITAIMGLQNGKEAKARLLNGLIRLYEQEQVAQFYDRELCDLYRVRYQLMMLSVIATGIVSFAIPLIILWAR